MASRGVRAMDGTSWCHPWMAPLVCPGGTPDQPREARMASRRPEWPPGRPHRPGPGGQNGLLDDQCKP